MSKFSVKLRNAASAFIATEGSEVSSPKAKIDTSTISPKQRAYVVSLLDGKLLPEGQQVPGVKLTYGELNRQEPRPNGAKGRHFPVVSGLSGGEAAKVIDALKALPDNPNAKRSYQPKAEKSAQSAEVAELKAQMAALIALVSGEAAPTPEPGHQMVSDGEAVEAEADDDGEAVEAVEAVEVAIGDYLLIDGELYQLGQTATGRVNVKLA